MNRIAKTLIIGTFILTASSNVAAQVTAPETTSSIELISLSYQTDKLDATTTIRFSLRRPTDVKLDVYDARGQWVVTLVDEFLDAGEQVVSWDGRDNNQIRKPAGVYYLSLHTDQSRATRRIQRFE